MTDTIRRLFKQMDQGTKEEALLCLKKDFQLQSRRVGKERMDNRRTYRRVLSGEDGSTISKSALETGCENSLISSLDPCWWFHVHRE